tara:strand:- start:362 stop:466 length:105 start_codon:yes stop_codon:yes gene_type:complete
MKNKKMVLIAALVVGVIYYMNYKKDDEQKSGIIS